MTQKKEEQNTHMKPQAQESSILSVDQIMLSSFFPYIFDIVNENYIYDLLMRHASYLLHQSIKAKYPSHSYGWKKTICSV